ncbi:MAG: hypothetical protein KGQ26_08880 [Rhodospirillales bacterium]|nr:hypothetical protein [Rhodospirillales bacterium]
MLASEGRPFTRETILKTAELAEASCNVQVLSIARIWGVALGFPNPWLLPSKREWAQQRDQVAAAIDELKALGKMASGSVIGARNATRRIQAEALRLNCAAIVMGADPPQNRLITDLLWSQEPYRIQKKAKMPVYLVLD